MWIEILNYGHYQTGYLGVTPFAGVWIEIQNAIGNGNIAGNVTPFAGVWIEIWEKCKGV